MCPPGPRNPWSMDTRTVKGLALGFKVYGFGLRTHGLGWVLPPLTGQIIIVSFCKLRVGRVGSGR